MANNVRLAEEGKDYSNHLRLVVLGKTGNGKSATINSLIGYKFLESGPSGAYVTENCIAVEFELYEKQILLVDTPGIGDLIRDENDILKELKKVMEYTYPGPHAFLIILSCQRFTKDEKDCVELISEFFGKEICDHSIIIFTRVDDLEHENILLDDYVDNCFVESFQQLIHQCNRRYLGVSNRWKQQNIEMTNFKVNFLDHINHLLMSKGEVNQIYSSKQFETSQKHMEAEKLRIQQLQISEQEKERKLNELILNLQNRVQQMQNTINDLSNRPSPSRRRRCIIQ